MQFQAALLQLAEKPLPPPPPPPRNRENFFTLDLSISWNFKQLWFSWQKSPPPPPRTGKIFLDWIYPFHAILSNFGFRWQKSPPGTGKIFRLDLSIFMQFWSNLGLRWQKSTPLFSASSWETRLVPPMWNTHSPHTTNPHSDFSYLNIFFRLPTLSTFQNTQI